MLKPQNTIGSFELAQITKRHALTIRRWTESGKLPQPKYAVGRTLLWDKLEAFEALQGLGYTVPDACNDGEFQK